jgi:hypothetical protein
MRRSVYEVHVTCKRNFEMEPMPYLEASPCQADTALMPMHNAKRHDDLIGECAAQTNGGRDVLQS